MLPRDERRGTRAGRAATVAAAAAAGTLLLALAACRAAGPTPDTKMNEPNTDTTAARESAAGDHGADPLSVHRRAITIDLHADTVQFMLDEGADISQRRADTHLDAVRMREGGLDAQFFSIWVEPNLYGAGGPGAVKRADEQIAAVRALAERRPETWTLATTAADIRRAAGEGKLSALLGLEGGYAIDGKLENVGRYFEMGVRYMSPTWTYSLSWAGSSGDAAGRTRGLSEFGREVVREMNRLGMMVDVSHVSDPTFWDIVETSTRPVIASHSNARAIVDLPRNLTDEQIRAIAKTGGVVCVVFYPAFVEPGWQQKKEAVDAEIAAAVDEAGRRATGRGSYRRLARDRVRAIEYGRRLPPVTAARVADHIDHIVRLVGVRHAGLGSDFDGIQAVPRDLSSAADFPNLTAELLRRGYKAEEVELILGGNVLRVMEEVERK
ncbi:MAG TPA: dipeptidase [Pyrinomonadaceae bacterium]|nr:dipeptidase [Pyrinomonadaceae bacterium]